MTRRRVLIIAAVAIAVFAVIYFWPRSTNADVTGRLHLGDGRARLGVVIGDPPRWDRPRRPHGPHKHWRPHPWFGNVIARPPKPRPVLILPYAVPRERVIIRESVVAPPPAPAEPIPVAAPPQPLDPQGRARTVAARGAERTREWVLGAVVPRDLPQVMLEPAAYGLPQPPSGQIYARVDGDVLRIETGSRRIVAVVSP